jgi:N6-L-threonylcarbamoyladenine synthase
VGLKAFRERYGPPAALVAAGGVAANEAIRKVLQRVAFEAGTALVVPPPQLCTDNGAMIAWAGAERLALGLTDTLATVPHARWPLGDVRGVAGLAAQAEGSEAGSPAALLAHTQTGREALGGSRENGTLGLFRKKEGA